MDKTEIANIALKMQNKDDLLKLLNLIKKEMSERQPSIAKFYPFTMKQLNFYCNPNHIHHRYRLFQIQKKSGGARQIAAPRNKCFMMLLRSVNEILKAIYVPNVHAMGFVEGRSVVNNAEVHKGENYVFNIDLKDFFPSIEQARVWKRLQAKPYCISPEIAGIIAGICSMRINKEKVDDDAKHENDKKFKYVLPQGAPTSPILTNMICERLDYYLGGLAKRFGVKYSRYADDITFSSPHFVYSKNGDFRRELNRIISEQGFVTNSSKTRLQKRGTRQEVTGIIVNEKLNVAHQYKRDIRNILHIWEKYGYNDAYSRFLPRYKSNKGHVKKGNPDLINVIEGKLLYMKMVKGEEDLVYKKLYAKFCKLRDAVLDKNKTNSKGTTFIQTLNISDFEDMYSTINIEIKEDGKPYAYFITEGNKQLISVESKIKVDMLNDKSNLMISICRGADDKSFWLIHRAHKINVPKPKPVDIDELNRDLDSLLNTWING